MNQLIQWCADHPEAALALGYVVLSLFNSLFKKKAGWAGGVLDKLHIVLDRVAVLARKDSAGTLKLPGRKSQ